MVFAPSMAGTKIYHKNFDVYSATVPIFYVLKILGLFPFVLEGTVRARRLEFSVSSAIHSVATLIIITYFRCLTIFSLFEMRSGLQMLNTVRCFREICYFFVNCFLAFLVVINSSTVAAILNTLSEFDNMLGGMTYICFKSVRYICIYLCFSFCGCVYFNTFFMFYKKFDIISTITINFGNLMFTCFNATHIHLMLLLKQRFECLNDQLLEVIQNSHKKTIESVPHKRNQGVHLPFKILPLSLANTSENFKDQLITIRHLHGKLCDTSDQFNYLYSLQTLLYVAISFLVLTVDSFVALLSIVTFEGGSVPRSVSKFTKWFEICYNVACVLVVAWSGSSVAQQVRRCFCKPSMEQSL
jgi:hypothetical protein